MEITELKIKKKELINDVQILLNKFREDTGCNIKDIHTDIVLQPQHSGTLVITDIEINL